MKFQNKLQMYRKDKRFSSSYAAHGPEAAPSRPGSHHLHYQENKLKYIDTYLG